VKLILCSDGDTTAQWTYARLRSLGCADLEIVTSGDLAYSLRWSHRVKSDGSAVDIHLADGRQINLASLEGVINRLNWPSRVLIDRAVRDDQDYAYSESFAFYLSWLHALPGKVFNRATPQGLCGTWRSAAQWAVLAGRAGFHVEPYRECENDWERSLPYGRTLTSIVLFEGTPFGQQVPEEIEAPCHALFALNGTSLLGIDLYQSEEGRWTFHSATPLPNMCLGGTLLLQEILRTWSSEAIQ
jgi:hypothetical protein